MKDARSLLTISYADGTDTWSVEIKFQKSDMDKPIDEILNETIRPVLPILFDNINPGRKFGTEWILEQVKKELGEAAR